MIAQLNYVWSTEFPLNLDDLPTKVIVRHFVFLVFLNMVSGDLHALLAVLVSPPERLGQVRHHEISHTPLQLLLGGLLCEGEAGPAPSFSSANSPHWEYCPRWSGSSGDHSHNHLAHSHLLLVDLLIWQIRHLPGQSLGELQILVKSGMSRFNKQPWAWACLLTLSLWSFSTSAAISVMEAFVLRCHWTTTTVSPSLPVDTCLYTVYVLFRSLSP